MLKKPFGFRASGGSACSSRLALISSWRIAQKRSCDAGAAQAGSMLVLESSCQRVAMLEGLVALEGELGLQQNCHLPGASLSCSWHQADSWDEHLPVWNMLGLF